MLVFRKPGFYLPRFALLAVAAGAVTSLVLFYNSLTNGNPLLFGYVVKYGAGHEIGFGHSAWGEGHTPLKGIVFSGHDLNMLNRFLFEWPIPALLPIGVLFASGVADRKDWLLAARFPRPAGRLLLLLVSPGLLRPAVPVRGGRVRAAPDRARRDGARAAGARGLFGLDVTDKAAARLIARAVPLCLLWALGGRPAAAAPVVPRAGQE